MGGSRTPCHPRPTVVSPRRPARWTRIQQQARNVAIVLAGSPQLLLATAGPVLAAPETGTTTQPPLPASAPAALSGSGTASGAPAANPAAPASAELLPAAPSAPAAPPRPGSRAPRSPAAGPQRGGPAAGGATASGPLELEFAADQQGYDAQLGRFVATGRVSARLAGGRILADRLEFDPTNRVLLATGRVRFQRGQQYLQASRLRFNLPEGWGEMEDVYGVLDLDGTAEDLDLSARPTAPLPPIEPISCVPDLPPKPDWRPFPWATTAWGGQMYTANFGDTFLFNGTYRPEYLAGLGLQRRLIDGGPFALEFDGNLLNHRSTAMPGGGFNQTVPYADTPAQNFGEGTAGLGLRFWVRPWLSLYVVEGVSLLTEPSNYEKTFRDKYTTLLNYLAFEVEALVSPRVSAIGRIHHRSGAYGTYSGVSEGSNGYLLGLRYRFGESPPPRQRVSLPPAQGCPGALPPENSPPRNLASQLDLVTMGAAPGDPAPAGTPPAAAPPRRNTTNVWRVARQQEAARNAAIEKLDQRVRDVAFERSLTAERRYGFPSVMSAPDAVNEFGGARPSQLNNLATASNSQMVQGTISRWRVQARKMRFTATTLTADRMAFSNDPFTPAQSWMDSENVVATLQPNGDTLIRTEHNHLVLEDSLAIPVTRSTRIKKEEEVDNRWVLGIDREDRDGYFVGYNFVRQLGKKAELTLQPQFLVQRAINGSTDSYPLPGQSANDPAVLQPAQVSDLFGLKAKLRGQVGNFDSNATLQVSSFNPDNIANGTRSWGDLARAVQLPLLGTSTWRLFGAYRFRTWNGTLGEQDVYSAYGTSLDATGDLPNWGKLSGNYLWRAGAGNFQSNDFTSNNLADFWRLSGIGSVNFNYPLWIGRMAPRTATAGFANTAMPVIPGLRLRANVLGSLAYYGDGSNQNTITLSGGPTLTLGHFIKPYLDYTELTITGGGTLRQGASPFSFDRAVDLGTLGIGLTQQIAGPLVFSGGVGLNVDPNSENYGEVTNSYIEFRWQRRAYEIGIYYSPYDGLGGVRVKLNDFNFNGPGLPFVPYSTPGGVPAAGPGPAMGTPYGPNPAIGPGQSPLSRPF